MNRLNYHYYLHDDFTQKTDEKLIVRLGRAHYWEGVKGVRKPSQLPGLTLSVNRSVISGRNGGLIMPTISMSYEISMDIVDEHILGQLLPAMFWEEGWNEEDEVIGVWVSIPRKNVENRMAKVRIDLGQPRDSALFSLVLSEISLFIAQLIAEEIDLNVEIIAPKKIHPLEGFRTIGSLEQSDWILAARDSHILADIDLRDPEAVSSALRIIDADSAAGNLILTKRKYWPFDVEAYPLRIQAASVHPALKYSLCQQILAIESLEEDSILALGFEQADNQLFLVLWLPSSTSKHTAERLMDFERMVLLKYQLHITMEFLDHQTVFRSENQPGYDLSVRYPYKLLVMSKQYEHIHLIKTAEDFAELQYSPESPTGYHLATLEKSRMMFYHSASPKLYLSKPEILALVCTTSSSNLAALIKGLDHLVSRANAIFYALKMAPALILIEPMEVIAEDHTGKSKRGRQQKPIKSQSPEIMSRFHLVLPGCISLSELSAENNMLSLLWRLTHQFIRSCGIRDKLELLELDAFRLEDIKAHSAPVFTQDLERSTDMIIKAVSGPSNADINRARTVKSRSPLTLKQLRERAQKREVEKEAAIRAQEEAIKAELDRKKREQEELEQEKIRLEQLRIENEARKLKETEDARRLAEEQELRQKERQAAAAAEAKRLKEAVALKAREKLSATSRPAYVEPKDYQKKSRRRPDPPQIQIKQAVPIAATAEVKAPIVAKIEQAVPVTATAEVKMSIPASLEVVKEDSLEFEPAAESEACEEPVHPRKPAKTVYFTSLNPLLPLMTERKRFSQDVLFEFY